MLPGFSLTQRVLQAANSGGFDFVFLHPEYLRDRSGGSLLVALRNNGISVAAYGYEPGFAHELIESAGVSVFMPGPTPQGLDLSVLGSLTAQMQAQTGMMMMGGTIQVCLKCMCALLGMPREKYHQQPSRCTPTWLTDLHAHHWKVKLLCGQRYHQKV